MGRPLKGRESQKTCLNNIGVTFADRGDSHRILRIKKGNPWIDSFRSGDFFAPDYGTYEINVERRRKMKTGVILYIVGGEGPYDDINMEEAVKTLDLKADRIETVYSRFNHFDIMDAWWSLTAKGMKQIVCMVAEIANSSGLRLTGRELRLCG